MKDFIDDYIVSTSSRKQERIYDILENASLGREELDKIAQLLTDTSGFPIMQTIKESFGQMILSTSFSMNFREMNNRIVQLYEISNQISVLLSNNIDTLSSEVKALEDELAAIEKSIDNYAFHIADGGAYDYVFVETFNDETMREKEPNFRLPDRTGSQFREEEQAFVDGSYGILSLNAGLQREFGLNGEITKSNCIGLKTRNQGDMDWFGGFSSTKPQANGYRVSIKSPRPINSTITQNTSYTGAQAMFEFTLNKPSPCDTILIQPYSDIPMDVLEVKIYKDESTQNGEVIIDTPKKLDRPMAVYFPTQNVYKFTIILNQPTYKRPHLQAKSSEEQQRIFSESIKVRQETEQAFFDNTFIRDKNMYKYVFLKTDMYNSRYPSFFRAQVPSKKFLSKGNDSRFTFLFKANDAANPNPWLRDSTMSDSIQHMIYSNVLPNNENFLSGHRMIVNSVFLANARQGKYLDITTHNSNPTTTFLGQLPSLKPETSATTVARSRTKPTYDYEIGYQKISIGTGSTVRRGVYLTKLIPAPGDSIEIRLSSVETDYSIKNPNLDNKQVTSIEYSVSNQSRPKNEAHWIPILPAGQDRVISERLFVNNAGMANFRFPAAASGGVTLYKNGVRFEYDELLVFVYKDGNVSGLRLPDGTFFDYDIFTVDYTPIDDPTVIKFSDYGFDQTTLATMHDANGPGETFSFGSGSDKTVVLSHSPYVDYEEVNDPDNASAYDDDGFSGSYQPITIILDDGTVAINQTNYLRTRQNSLADYATDEVVYFLHSGSNIIFNQVISQPFTVYYQYLPSNIRVRVVMRVNTKTYVSPIVDSFRVKMKVRKPDQMRTS